MWWNGQPKRSASVLGEGDRAQHVPELTSRRGRCARCKEPVRLHPPGVIAHKHYQPCVIARAVHGHLFERKTLAKVADEIGCSPTTVRRWVIWVSELGEPAVVLRMILEATDAVVVPIVRAAAATGDVLRRAAEMLGLFEVLGSAWGLEPPGLRAVLCRVLYGRTGLATYARPLLPEFARGPPA